MQMRCKLSQVQKRLSDHRFQFAIFRITYRQKLGCELLFRIYLRFSMLNYKGRKCSEIYHMLCFDSRVCDILWTFGTPYQPYLRKAGDPPVLYRSEPLQTFALHRLRTQKVNCPPVAFIIKKCPVHIVYDGTTCLAPYMHGILLYRIWN